MKNKLLFNKTHIYAAVIEVTCALTHAQADCLIFFRNKKK